MEISKRTAYFGMVAFAIMFALMGSGLITISNYAYADHDGEGMEYNPRCDMSDIYHRPPCPPPKDSLPI